MLHLNNVVSAKVHEQTIGLLTRSIERHLLSLQQVLALVHIDLPRVIRVVRLPPLIQRLNDGTQQAVLGRPALQRKPTNDIG